MQFLSWTAANTSQLLIVWKHYVGNNDSFNVLSFPVTHSINYSDHLRHRESWVISPRHDTKNLSSSPFHILILGALFISDFFFAKGIEEREQSKLGVLLDRSKVSDLSPVTQPPGLLERNINCRSLSASLHLFRTLNITVLIPSTWNKMIVPPWVRLLFHIAQNKYFSF